MVTLSNLLSRTFSKATSESDILSFLGNSHPAMAEREYATTHAKRFATSVELALEISSCGRILDIAGNDISAAIFSHFLEPSVFTSTPRGLDIEIDDWFEHLEQGSFDLAVCTEVIEHMSADPAHVLYSANRALAMGGYLLLSTPNIGSYLGVYNIINGRAPYHWGVLFAERVNRHHREYAPLELQELIAVNGFRAEVLTADVYHESPAHQQAREWILKYLPHRNDALMKDTIFVIAEKVEELERPVRLEPVYDHSVADPRDDKVLASLQSHVISNVRR